MADTMLNREFEYYLRNQDSLVKSYNGKYVVIIGDRVVGAYRSDEEALSETTKEHELGTFLIQKCSPGNADYTRTYHSRVTFA